MPDQPDDQPTWYEITEASRKAVATVADDRIDPIGPSQQDRIDGINAAPDAGDDALRLEIAENIERELRAHPTITATPSNPGVIGTFGGMSPHALADALLPLIRKHTAAAELVELTCRECDITLHAEGDGLRGLHRIVECWHTRTHERT